MGVGGGMGDVIRVKGFSERRDVADGSEEEREFVDVVFGFAEKGKVSQRVIKNGHVIVKFDEGWQLGCKGESKSGEVSSRKHERVTVKCEDFCHDDGGCQVESEGDWVGYLGGEVGAN